MRLRDEETRKVEVKKRARKYFGRYNCAQSVMLSVSSFVGIKIPEEMLKSARVFTGGIGYSGCLCGALGGALLVIGHLYPDSEKKAKEFFDMFKKEFGSSCCRALRKGIGFEDRKLKKHCSRITEETASILLSFIQEGKNGIDNNSHAK